MVPMIARLEPYAGIVFLTERVARLLEYQHDRSSSTLLADGLTKVKSMKPAITYRPRSSCNSPDPSVSGH